MPSYSEDLLEHFSGGKLPCRHGGLNHHADGAQGDRTSIAFVSIENRFETFVVRPRLEPVHSSPRRSSGCAPAAPNWLPLTVSRSSALLSRIACVSPSLGVSNCRAPCDHGILWAEARDNRGPCRTICSLSPPARRIKKAPFPGLFSSFFSGKT